MSTGTIDTKALRERFTTAVEEFGKCYCVDYFSDWSVEYDWLDPEYPTAEIRLELMPNEFRTVPLCLSGRDELAIDIGDAGILDADGYGLMSFLWNEAEQALSAANDRLAKIERLAETGTAQSFAALSDDDKPRWFAITGQRDKWARERLAALEAELSEAQSKCADMHTENANLASETGSWRRVAERLEAENERLRARMAAVSDKLKRIADAVANGDFSGHSLLDERLLIGSRIDDVAYDDLAPTTEQQDDWPEDRVDAIGQNGNDGHHYADAERGQEGQGDA